MEKQIKGEVAFFLEPSTDTDVIIPARFLKRTSLDHFEPFAFFEKKYLSTTICEPTIETKDFVFQKKEYNPDCTLNHPNSREAIFLLTWYNFGCGSSREHAVYALRNYKVIIGSAPNGKSAFADIFRDNCKQNLIWTPIISEENHHRLVQMIKDNIKKGPIELILDIEENLLFDKNQIIEIPIEIPESHKEYIIHAKDPFVMAKDQITQYLTEIKALERDHIELMD